MIKKILKLLKDPLLILAISILLTLMIWLPHLVRLNNFYQLNFDQGFNTIFRNYDGINYIIVAKTLYSPRILETLPQSLPSNYYAAQFPGYSILILIFSPLIGFLKSMLFVSFLFTALSAIAFYYLVKNFKLTKHPLLLSLIFLCLPARWVIVHSVGSAEPVFIFFIILSLYFFLKFEILRYPKYIWLTAIFASLAQFTRPPGFLLFLAIVIYVFFKDLIQKKFKNLTEVILNYYPLFLIPLTLFAIFSWFFFTLNDFLAYFHSGDNIHLVFPPFQVFNINQYWVGDIWLEDIVYILLVTLFSGILLIKQDQKIFAFFVLTYFSATIFVTHRDISRYILPVFPFVLIAFEKILTSKEFRIALLILLPAIYFYTQNFILQNTAPFPNLSYFD